MVPTNKFRRWLKRAFKWLASASSVLISILLTVNKLLPSSSSL